MAEGLALVNGKVFINWALVDASIFAEDGKVSKISRSAPKKADKVLDCSGLIILPGVIDSHVHFREPGMAQKEDWGTGSRAAAAGGVTTVIDMPNTIPPTTTAKRLLEKQKIAEKESVIDYRFHFGAEKGNGKEIAKSKGIASVKVFMGSSTGGLLLEEDSDILSAFSSAKKKGVPATVHAEDESLICDAGEGLRDSRMGPLETHARSRPALAAVYAVWRALLISQKAGNRLHFLHMSSGQELGALAEARALGSHATCEATPHHLFLSVKDSRHLGNFGKANPPIRSEQDRVALLHGLESGFIDTVASDHAPHTAEEKRQSFWKAPSGVPGVQTLLPLLLNERAKGNLSLRRLVEAVAEHPGLIFSLEGKGRIGEGMDADFAIVDPKKEWVIRDEGMLYKCGWTPFHGMRVKGSVEKTVSRGELVFDGA